MDGLAIVKVSDLQAVLNEVKSVKVQLREMQENNDLKSFSIQKTADMIGLSYNSIRKLILEEELTPTYLNTGAKKGRCVIPAWSIKEYLTKKRIKIKSKK